MTAVVVLATALVAIAAVLAVIRLERGPSMLDRTLALDILTSAILVGVAIEAAWNRRTDSIPLLVAIALVGFIGSVTISRFASVEPEEAKRIKSRAEAAAEDARRRAAEERLLRSEPEGPDPEPEAPDPEPAHPEGPEGQR